MFSGTMNMVEDKNSIRAYDLNGAPITIGSYVKYLNTGTTGQVTELKEEEGTIWALLDTTGLYYNVLALVVTDANAIKIKKEREAGKVNKEDLLKEQPPEKVVDIGQVTGGG